MARIRPRALIVDDDRAVRLVLHSALEKAGFAAESHERAEHALASIREAVPDVAFLDLRMPGLSGLDALARIKRIAPRLPVIVITAYGDLEATVSAFGSGAFEFLAKPFDLNLAVALARRAVELVQLSGEEGEVAAAAGLIGRAPAMLDLYRTIGRLSRSSLSALITGPTGVGKELVARALHRHSPRASGPWVAINTAAIPAELLESELFGHERGAFTGAGERKIGRFEQAHRGTLFLDEIGDMPASLQTRLLRVLSGGEFFRVGGTELIAVDVRVIAATHQNLVDRVAQGLFRADLLHRLDVVRLEVPALAARREDIRLLVTHFLKVGAQRAGVDPKRCSEQTLMLLEQGHWPGNVRQLENLCLKLAVMAPGQQVEAHDLPADWDQRPPAPSSQPTHWLDALELEARAALKAGQPGLYRDWLDQVETRLIDVALELSDGDQSAAAKKLGIGRNTIGRKRRRL